MNIILKCQICDRSLSIFPIATIETGGYICGRCSVPDGLSYKRNIVYEELIAYYYFPCQYQKYGCNEEFIPEDLIIHESTCYYKYIKCPLECTWKGNINDLCNHFSYGHDDILIRNNTMFELESSQTEKVIIHNNQPYIIKVERDGDKFKINVNAGNPMISDTMYTANVKLDVQYVKSLPLQMYNNCDELEFDIANKTFQKVNLSCQIIRVDEDIIEYDSIKKQIICAFCLKYCDNHIYFCCTTTSCNNCIKIAKCTCANNNFVRNLSLEEIAYEVKYCCKYKKCSKILSKDEKKAHEKKCPFQLYNCMMPLCKYLGKFNEMWTHVNSFHKNLIVNDNIVDFKVSKTISTGTNKKPSAVIEKKYTFPQSSTNKNQSVDAIEEAHQITVSSPKKLREKTYEVKKQNQILFQAVIQNSKNNSIFGGSVQPQATRSFDFTFPAASSMFSTPSSSSIDFTLSNLPPDTSTSQNSSVVKKIETFLEKNDLKSNIEKKLTSPKHDNNYTYNINNRFSIFKMNNCIFFTKLDKCNDIFTFQLYYLTKKNENKQFMLNLKNVDINHPSKGISIKKRCLLNEWSNIQIHKQALFNGNLKEITLLLRVNEIEQPNVD